jgi:hypothetical protein
MHDGYDRDDIYIMVEDEFQTVAQSFTAHLHQAEYKRLVKEAKEAGPKALPEPTSPISKQAKNRLQATKLKKRQDDTLRRTGIVRTTAAEEDEENLTDLWSGTSLAPLMISGSQEKRSLVGLQGMSSSTKAGHGITRSQGSQSLVQISADRPCSGDSAMSVTCTPVVPQANPNGVLHTSPVPIERPDMTRQPANSSNGIIYSRPVVPQAGRAAAARAPTPSVPARTLPETAPNTRPTKKPRFDPIDLNDGFGPLINTINGQKKADATVAARMAPVVTPKSKVMQVQEANEPEREIPIFSFV